MDIIIATFKNIEGSCFPNLKYYEPTKGVHRYWTVVIKLLSLIPP